MSIFRSECMLTYINGLKQTLSVKTMRSLRGTIYRYITNALKLLFLCSLENTNAFYYSLRLTKKSTLMAYLHIFL